MKNLLLFIFIRSSSTTSSSSDSLSDLSRGRFGVCDGVAKIKKKQIKNYKIINDKEEKKLTHKDRDPLFRGIVVFVRRFCWTSRTHSALH